MVERMASETRGDEEFENISPTEVLPLLPEGIYPALWLSKTRGRYFGTEKMTFLWRIFTASDYETPESTSFVLLPAYYNVRRDEKSGRLRFGAHSAYRKDWIAANNGKHPPSATSLPLSVFQGRLILVQVVTVKKDARGPLRPTVYWSKVQRVIRPVFEGEILRGIPFQLDDIA